MFRHYFFKNQHPKLAFTLKEFRTWKAFAKDLHVSCIASSVNLWIIRSSLFDYEILSSSTPTFDVSVLSYKLSYPSHPYCCSSASVAKMNRSDVLPGLAPLGSCSSSPAGVTVFTSRRVILSLRAFLFWLPTIDFCLASFTSWMVGPLWCFLV